MYIYFILIAFVLLQAAANFILKSSGQNAKTFIEQYLNWSVPLALVFYGLSFVLWVHALAKTKLSVAISFSVLNYVVIMLGSFFLFHEKFGVLSVIGALLITTGLYLVVLGQG